MENNRSLQMTIADECAYIATMEQLGLSEDEMYKEVENGHMVYATEEIQDTYNEYYVSFDTIVTKHLIEKKVYIVSSETSSNDKHTPGTSMFDAESFKAFAEKEGIVYSLKGFQESFNKVLVNTDIDYILID